MSFLRSIFNRGSSGTRRSGKGKQKEVVEFSEEERQRHRGDAMNESEVTRFRHGFEVGGVSLDDQFDSHKKGSIFKYSVVAIPRPSDRGKFLDRVRTFRPKKDQSTISLDDIPGLDMVDDFNEFRLVDAVGEKSMREMNDYVMISEVLVHFTPLDTFFTEFVSLTLTIRDNRRMEQAEVRKAPFASNTSVNVFMSLDYCVKKSDLHRLTLALAGGPSHFRPGTVWGTVKVVVRMRHMTFPERGNLEETMACLQFAETDLRVFNADPRVKDVVLTPNALGEMQKRFQDGDIEDLTKARSDKRKVETAATIVQGVNENPIDNVLDSFRAQARRVGKETMVTDSGPVMRKSVMKKTEPDTPVDPRDKQDLETLKGLSEVRLDESASVMSDNVSVETPIRVGPLAKMTRFDD